MLDALRDLIHERFEKARSLGPTFDSQAAAVQSARLKNPLDCLVTAEVVEPAKPARLQQPREKRKVLIGSPLELREAAAPLIRQLEHDISYHSHTSRDDQILVVIPKHLVNAKGPLDVVAAPLVKAALKMVKRMEGDAKKCTRYRTFA